MHFSYRNQFSTIDEAQRFVEENDIVYSLCFGPVMIDNSVDVTPDNYQWGEIWDTYARAAIGMLGEHHYLTMNLNCGTGHLYHYATLRQAADAMVERGCIKAYTLDGGQTCCTVVNGELVSPVQFGNERYTSDIIYFATAIAGNEAV
jgi:exopolysaccharide biosynthesis protein